ncbi:MAG: hypothetical protein FWF28_09425, partial [Micrococcales bacterium]|nr:hypothetical protein [Micrococcales bacterium]
MNKGRLLAGMLALATTMALGAGMAASSYADPGSNNGNGNGNNGNNGKGNITNQATVETGQQGTPLKGFDSKCSGFSMSGWNGILTFNVQADAKSYAVWHLVDSGTNGNTKPAATYMEVLFKDSAGATHLYTWTPVGNPPTNVSTNGGGKNPGWVIMTPADYTVVSGTLVKALNQFNVSGCGIVNPPPTTGTWSATVNATMSYDEVTYQPMWQKTYLPFNQKTIQPYEKKIFDVVKQKTYQPYDQMTCTYAKVSTPSGTNTWVTQSKLAFNNGHTYVAIDVAAASSGVLTFQVAD